MASSALSRAYALAYAMQRRPTRALARTYFDQLQAILTPSPCLDGVETGVARKQQGGNSQARGSFPSQTRAGNSNPDESLGCGAGG